MRMTLVFACLQCNQYTIANVYNLHVLTYHQQERRLLPFADLVANDVGLFSEEAGEIAFSLLSRSTLGDSVEDKHKHLSNNFCAIGAMKDLNLSAMAAEDEDESPSYSRAFIENDDPEVIALQEHFRGVLRALEDSSFSSYPSVAFLKKNHRFSAPLTQEPSKTLVLNPRMQLQRVWANVRGLDRDWGQQFAERLGFDMQLHAPAVNLHGTTTRKKTRKALLRKSHNRQHGVRGWDFLKDRRLCHQLTLPLKRVTLAPVSVPNINIRNWFSPACCVGDRPGSAQGSRVSSSADGPLAPAPIATAPIVTQAVSDGGQNPSSPVGANMEASFVSSAMRLTGQRRRRKVQDRGFFVSLDEAH